MRVSSPVVLVPLLGACWLSACGRPLNPNAACSDARDCAAGQTCSAGVCTDAGAVPCTTDLDCDPSLNQVCGAGVCVDAGDGGGGGGGGSCTATADCPTTEYCNTATGVCSLLLDGWCRLDSQCDAAAPICSNRAQGPAAPGRCVQCVDDSDCAAGSCVAPGVCQDASPQPGSCPVNASPIAGGGCRCNPGFVDDGAGGCEANAPTTGEGEGEGAGAGEGEGEDEGEGGGDGSGGGESCTSAFECFELHDVNWTCDNQQCICDVPWLEFTCEGAIDVARCACDTGGGGSGGGGGGGGAGTSSTMNDACLDDSDCGDLSCIFPDATALLGSCKQVCSSDADCDGGLACMTGFFGDGSGICANIRAAGASCSASVWNESWMDSNDICAYGAAVSDPILDCFNGVCEQVCNWEGNTGAPESCAAGTCGDPVFRVEANADVAVCE